MLSDKTRCDCITESHAVEVDYASKWYQAIGQSLHYSVVTGKKPGVVLIAGPDDQKYIDRLRRVIKTNDLEVTVWIVEEVK